MLKNMILFLYKKSNLNKSEKIMTIKQVLKNGKCAKCGEEQEYIVVEEIFNENENLSIISLERYLNFKNPFLNVCNKCGYISLDLSQNLNTFSTLNKEDIAFPNGVISFDGIYQLYAQNSPLDLNCMRVFAKIFDLHEFSIRSIYTEHFGDKNFNFEQISKLHKRLVEQLLEACKLYQKNNGENYYVTCLQIEFLACLEKTNEAIILFNSISKDLNEDLQDYLLECIEMGENDEKSATENSIDGGEN